MILVFISNFLNHHQFSLCQSLKKRCDKFYFIETQDILKAGYLEAMKASFVIHYYLNEEKELAHRLIVEADVVIFGACPNELITLRMKNNRLSFVFSERFLKRGRWRRFIPRTRKQIMERVARYKNDSMYVLAASAYLPEDIALFGYPKEKCYRWGYFPKVIHYDIEELFAKKKKNEKIRLLWVARLIPIKRPEMMIALAQKLRDKGYDFYMDILGDGEMSTVLNKMICDSELEEHVFMHGACDHDKVIRYMERADIFYLTSNRYEGWGVVLNEAMNSGCAVISCVECGATKYLIESGKNGYYFTKEKELYDLTLPLINNVELRKTIGIEAYKTIVEQWNHEVAAERFFNIVNDIEETGKSERYKNGPCSNPI